MQVKSILPFKFGSNGHTFRDTAEQTRRALFQSRAFRFVKETFNTQTQASRPGWNGKRKRAKSVLVTGGAGYIGSVMVRELLARDYRVRVLDSLLYEHRTVGDLLHRPNFELVVGDFRDVEPVVRACRGIDAVIHLGAIVGDPACALDPSSTLEVNFAATKMLTEICRGYGIPRLLFASTCSVYGASDHIVDEESAVNPLSLYASTKLDAEQAILSAASPDFHPTILRLATAFGSSYRPRFDLVVNLLTMKALAEGKITIYNGTQWRPFIHVRDIARCFIACLESPVESVSGQVFNAGSDGMNLTLGQVARIICGYVPDAKVEYIENGDKRNYRVSFNRIRARLGFSCEKTVQDGVFEIKQLFERKLVRDYRDKQYSNHAFLVAAAESAERTPDINLPITAALVSHKFVAQAAGRL